MTTQIVVCIATLFSFLLIRYVANPELKYFQNYRRIIIFFTQLSLISMLVITSFGRMVQAQWGPEDDNEIVYFMGPDRKLEFSEFIPTLLSTEVGQFGNSLRVRPVYYSLRILETIVWGPNPAAWYIFRILLCIASLLIYWKTFEMYYPSYISGILTLLIFFKVSTIDLFTRLGPGETYGYFALALFLWSISKVVLDISNKRITSGLNLILLSVSYLIAIGVKESLFILAIPLIFILLYVIKNRQNRRLTVALVSLLIPTTVMILAVTRALILAGHDFYSSDISIMGRLQLLGSLLSNVYLSSLFFATILATTFCFYIIYQKLISKQRIEVIVTHLVIVWSSVLVYISQYLFYSGDWPRGNRYDFPGIVVIPLFFASLAICIRVILISLSNTRLRSYLFWSNTNALFIIITLASLYSTYSSHLFAHTSSELVKFTQDYTMQIQLIAETIKKYDPNTPIVLEIASINDYEQIDSLNRFLRFNNVKNSTSIHSAIDGSNTFGDFSPLLYSILSGSIDERSRNGDQEFSSLQSVDNTTCLSIDTINPFHDEVKIDSTKVYCKNRLSNY